MKQADIDKWIELGTLRERQRIIRDFKSVCRCNEEQTAGYFCAADWAIKIVKEEFKGGSNAA